MRIEDEIFINQYGQGIKSDLEVKERFDSLEEKEKQAYFHDLMFLILQSKAELGDIEIAARLGKLKQTLTPVVMLKKGINQSNLERLSRLKGKEMSQAFILLINLFKVGYDRRFQLEKGDPNKWWYWDLSNEDNLSKIKAQTEHGESF